MAEKAVNTIRILCADMVQKANSGHPGAPMGLAPSAHLLWTKFLKYNPANAKWANRDRFVLSNGHACALQYAMLHLTGYTDWSMDDLKAFRQIGSKTPGHPESLFPGIEISTGPLGQGISSAVGLAIAEAHLAARFNKPNYTIVDHFTYVFCGDGCLQEGVSSEASSLAGHLGLGKLIVLYDDNHITIDGETELSFTENVVHRYESYGWHVQSVHNADNDLDSISRAIEAAKAVTDKPSLIKITTTIGFGSAKQGTEAVHGSPLGKDDLANVKKKFGFDPAQSFVVSEDIYKVYNHTEQGAASEKEWSDLLSRYSQEYPELAAEFTRRMKGELPAGWKDALPKYTSHPPTATRKLGQASITALAKVLPELMGGSADLNPSTFTYLDISKDFQKGHYAERNIRFGVREHGMLAIVNGLSAHGGVIPYGSTFLNFLGYALGAFTVGALSHYHSILVMTHDSIGLGEDGPTHQAVEKYMICRETPNVLFLRPADGNETSAAWAIAIENSKKTSVLALSRQNLPFVNGSFEGTFKGGYVLNDSEGKPDIVLIGTGSELSLCVEAKEKLQAAGVKVRVVSMPCWELFEAQPIEYRESVLLPGVPAMSVEAGTVGGWPKFAHAHIAMRSFGTSGPYQEVYKRFGITTDNVVEKAKLTVEFYKSTPCPNLLRKPFYVN